MSQFLVGPSGIDEAGGRAVIKGEEAHHLVRVTRVKAGGEVRIFDGAGKRFLGVASDIQGEMVVLENLRPLPSNEPGREILVAQALIKGDRWEWFLEKAVELGASGIVPLLTSRTIARPESEASAKKVERWEKLLISAAKQCERGKIPAVSGPLTLESFLGSLGPAGETEERFYCAERSGSRFLSPAAGARKCTLAVGPEGGWSEAEAKAIEKAGFVPVSLGARILRSETAAIAALAVLLAAEGR